MATKSKKRTTTPAGVPEVTREMTPEIAATIAANAPTLPEDQLMKLRKMVSQARDLEKERNDLNERLKELNSQLDGPEGLYFRQLPALMSEIGVPSMSIDADGNLPAVEVRAMPYYMANIAASWDEERRRRAFDYLDDNDAGDLIKTEVTVAFPREQREMAKKFQEVARKYGDATIKENVAWNTLTAWLKEQVEEHGTIPALDVIGGTVARIVKLKEKK